MKPLSEQLGSEGRLDYEIPRMTPRLLDQLADESYREILRTFHPDRELFREIQEEDVQRDPTFARYRGYLRAAASRQQLFVDVDDASLEIQSLSEVLSDGEKLFTLADFEADPFASHNAFEPLPIRDMQRKAHDQLPATVFRARDSRTGQSKWYQYDREFHLVEPVGGIYEVDGEIQTLPSVETFPVSPDSQVFYELHGEHLNVDALLKAFENFAQGRGRKMMQLFVPAVSAVKTPLFAVLMDDGKTEWMTIDLNLFRSRWWARHNASPEVQSWLRQRDEEERQYHVKKSAELSDDGEIVLSCTVNGESFDATIRAHDQDLSIAREDSLTPAQRQLVAIILKRFKGKLSSEEGFRQLSPAKKMAFFVRYITRASEENRFPHSVPVGKDLVGNDRIQVVESDDQHLRLWISSDEGPFECRIDRGSQGSVLMSFSVQESVESQQLKAYFGKVLKKCQGNLLLFVRLLKDSSFSPWSLDCGIRQVRSTRTPSGVMRRIHGSDEFLSESQAG